MMRKLAPIRIRRAKEIHRRSLPRKKLRGSLSILFSLFLTLDGTQTERRRRCEGREALVIGNETAKERKHDDDVKINDMEIYIALPREMCVHLFIRNDTVYQLNAPPLSPPPSPSPLQGQSGPSSPLPPPFPSLPQQATSTLRRVLDGKEEKKKTKTKTTTPPLNDFTGTFLSIHLAQEVLAPFPANPFIL